MLLAQPRREFGAESMGQPALVQDDEPVRPREGDLVADLLRPEAYPAPHPGRVELRETHVSQVFLTEGDVFKALVDITGVGKGRLRVDLLIPDKPGSIREVADLCRTAGGRIFSILGFVGLTFAILLRIRETGPHGHGLETITAGKA